MRHRLSFLSRQKLQNKRAGVVKGGISGLDLLSSQSKEPTGASNVEIDTKLREYTLAAVADIDNELAAYEQMRPELEARHMGEWVLIRGSELVGMFESFEIAANEAVKKFGRGPYLIRQVGAAAVTMPASVAYFQYGSDKMRF